MKYWEQVWPSAAPQALAIRAAETKRWIEQSGPDYTEMTFRLIDRDKDSVTLDWDDDGPSKYSARLMSYASWQLARQAPLGTMIDLKIRLDDVAHA